MRMERIMLPYRAAERVAEIRRAGTANANSKRSALSCHKTITYYDECATDLYF